MYRQVSMYPGILVSGVDRVVVVMQARQAEVASILVAY